MYNDKTYYENEFRRIQESRRNPAPGTEPQQYHMGEKMLGNSDRQYLGRILSGFLEQRNNESERDQCCGRGDQCWTHLTAKGNTFSIIKVSAKTFHDVFEINRTFLLHGELVDLHDDYDDCKCFLTSDGLAGFAIEPDGNLISVFSQYSDTKPGFLHAIKDFVIEQGATHCDCYDSKLQPLPAIYEKTLGWQEASRMKYNMTFDHDDIAANHGKPDIAFLVYNRHKVEKHEFDENEYNEASLWQKTSILKNKTEGIDFKNLYYLLLNCGDKEMTGEEVSLIYLYDTFSEEEKKDIVEASSLYLQSLILFLHDKTILPSLRLREQEILTLDKEAEFSCNLNNCKDVYPGTQDKVWGCPPYIVTEIEFSTPPYAEGKPLNECPGWNGLNADWGHIDSITIQNGNGESKKFSGEQIDRENRLVFNLEDITVKYGIETGKAEFYPHLKKSESQTRAIQNKPQNQDPPKHKQRGRHR